MPERPRKLKHLTQPITGQEIREHAMVGVPLAAIALGLSESVVFVVHKHVGHTLRNQPIVKV